MEALSHREDEPRQIVSRIASAGGSFAAAMLSFFVAPLAMVAFTTRSGTGHLPGDGGTPNTTAAASSSLAAWEDVVQLGLIQCSISISTGHVYAVLHRFFAPLLSSAEDDAHRVRLLTWIGAPYFIGVTLCSTTVLMVALAAQTGDVAVIWAIPLAVIVGFWELLVTLLVHHDRWKEMTIASTLTALISTLLFFAMKNTTTTVLTRVFVSWFVAILGGSVLLVALVTWTGSLSPYASLAKAQLLRLWPRRTMSAGNAIALAPPPPPRPRGFWAAFASSIVTGVLLCGDLPLIMGLELMCASRGATPGGAWSASCFATNAPYLVSTIVGNQLRGSIHCFAVALSAATCIRTSRFAFLDKPRQARWSAILSLAIWCVVCAVAFAFIVPMRHLLVGLLLNTNHGAVYESASGSVPAAMGFACVHGFLMLAVSVSHALGSKIGVFVSLVWLSSSVALTIALHRGFASSSGVPEGGGGEDDDYLRNDVRALFIGPLIASALSAVGCWSYVFTRCEWTAIVVNAGGVNDGDASTVCRLDAAVEMNLLRRGVSVQSYT